MAKIADKDHALNVLEQLGTFIMTKKAPLLKDNDAFADDVHKTLNLYRTKVNKAETSEQFTDIVEAAKYDIKSVFDSYKE